MFHTNRPIKNKTFQVIAIFLEIIAVIGLVSYFTIGLLIAAHFRYLRFDMENYLEVICGANWPIKIDEVLKRESPKLLYHLLKKWRRTYSKLTDIIHQFQICFDSILLIWIVYIFISFISNTFYFVVVFTRFGTEVELTSDLAIFSIRNGLNLFALTTIPAIIHHEVRETA